MYSLEKSIGSGRKWKKCKFFEKKQATAPSSHWPWEDDAVRRVEILGAGGGGGGGTCDVDEVLGVLDGVVEVVPRPPGLVHLAVCQLDIRLLIQILPGGDTCQTCSLEPEMSQDIWD